MLNSSQRSITDPTSTPELKMPGHGIIQVANETNAVSSRITKSGKKITYKMHVLQQPERARACGSGAKSSADRRPVDPPPIVELCIYEGPNAERDITSEYKANFFLFATLDNARHMQHGRVPQQNNLIPVLTGTPVAGMAHLERPHPAAYFIFPDLSVRHEVRYRLGFSLYEELKDRDDMDPEVADNPEKHTNPHVSHRLEVKSQPFTVFSAKRFPGLAESTTLSKVFAEQGCRVRIRRDVRMRRRGNDKPQDYEEEDYDQNRHNSSTPERSVHNHNLTQDQHIDRPHTSSSSRRSSHEHLASHYPQQYHHNNPLSPQNTTSYTPSSWNSHYSAPPPPPSVSTAQYPQNYSGQSPTMPPPPSFGYQGHTRTGSIDYNQPPTGPPRPVHSQAFPPPSHIQPSPVDSAHSHVSSPASYTARSTSYNSPKHESSYSSNSPPAFYQTATSVKRTYGSTFDTTNINKPLRQGERPADPRYSSDSVDSVGIEADSDEEWKTEMMSYRRADGTKILRKLPAVI